MTDPHRDAWGALIVSPDSLPREARIECLRGAAGKLQAFNDLELRWLGRVLGARMREGSDLEVMFALRPTRGSRATAEALGRSAEINRMLVQLAHAVGAPRGSLDVRPSCVGAHKRTLFSTPSPLPIRPQEVEFVA